MVTRGALRTLDLPLKYFKGIVMHVGREHGRSTISSSSNQTKLF